MPVPDRDVNLQEVIISNQHDALLFEKIEGSLKGDRVVGTRCSPVLMRALIEIIQKELKTHRFHNVNTLLTCIQNIASDDSDEEGLPVLLENGLTELLVYTYEEVIKYTSPLSPTQQQSPADTCLLQLLETINDVADFDSFCKENLAQLFVEKLMVFVISEGRNFATRMEAVRTLNLLLEGCPVASLKCLQSNREIHKMLDKFAEFLPRCGDFEMQVACTETLARIVKRSDREVFCRRCFPDDDVAEGFLQMRDACFEVDCRTFLNTLNQGQGDESRVVSMPCSEAFLGDYKLRCPQDDQLVEMWVDFNAVSRSITIYVADESSSNEESSMWETVTITDDLVVKCEIKKLSDSQHLTITLSVPAADLLPLSKSDSCTALIVFAPDQDLQRPLALCYSQDKLQIPARHKTSECSIKVLFRRMGEGGGIQTENVYLGRRTPQATSHQSSEHTSVKSLSVPLKRTKISTPVSPMSTRLHQTQPSSEKRKKQDVQPKTPQRHPPKRAKTPLNVTVADKTSEPNENTPKKTPVRHDSVDEGTSDRNPSTRGKGTVTQAAKRKDKSGSQSSDLNGSDRELPSKEELVNGSIESAHPTHKPTSRETPTRPASETRKKKTSSDELSHLASDEGKPASRRKKEQPEEEESRDAEISDENVSPERAHVNGLCEVNTNAVSDDEQTNVHPEKSRRDRRRKTSRKSSDENSSSKEAQVNGTREVHSDAVSDDEQMNVHPEESCRGRRRKTSRESSNENASSKEAQVADTHEVNRDLVSDDAGEEPDHPDRSSSGSRGRKTWRKSSDGILDRSASRRRSRKESEMVEHVDDASDGDAEIPGDELRVEITDMPKSRQEKQCKTDSVKATSEREAPRRGESSDGKGLDMDVSSRKEKEDVISEEIEENTRGCGRRRSGTGRSKVTSGEEGFTREEADSAGKRRPKQSQRKPRKVDKLAEGSKSVPGSGRRRSSRGEGGVPTERGFLSDQSAAVVQPGDRSTKRKSKKRNLETDVDQEVSSGKQDQDVLLRMEVNDMGAPGEAILEVVSPSKERDGRGLHMDVSSRKEKEDGISEEIADNIRGRGGRSGTRRCKVTSGEERSTSGEADSGRKGSQKRSQREPLKLAEGSKSDPGSGRRREEGGVPSERGFLSDQSAAVVQPGDGSTKRKSKKRNEETDVDQEVTSGEHDQVVLLGMEVNDMGTPGEDIPGVVSPSAKERDVSVKRAGHSPGGPVEVDDDSHPAPVEEAEEPSLRKDESSADEEEQADPSEESGAGAKKKKYIGEGDAPRAGTAVANGKETGQVVLEPREDSQLIICETQEMIPLADQEEVDQLELPKERGGGRSSQRIRAKKTGGKKRSPRVVALKNLDALNSARKRKSTSGRFKLYSGAKGLLEDDSQDGIIPCTNPSQDSMSDFVPDSCPTQRNQPHSRIPDLSAIPERSAESTSSEAEVKSKPKRPRRKAKGKTRPKQAGKKTKPKRARIDDDDASSESSTLHKTREFLSASLPLLSPLEENSADPYLFSDVRGSAEKSTSADRGVAKAKQKSAEPMKPNLNIPNMESFQLKRSFMSFPSKSLTSSTIADHSALMKTGGGDNVMISGSVGNDPAKEKEGPRKQKRGPKTAGKKKGGEQKKVIDSTRDGQDRESDMENGQDYDLDAMMIRESVLNYSAKEKGRQRNQKKGSKMARNKRGGKQEKVIDSSRNGQDRESDMDNGQDYDLDALMISESVVNNSAKEKGRQRNQKKGSEMARNKKGGKQEKVIDSTRNGQDRESDMEHGQDYDLDALMIGESVVSNSAKEKERQRKQKRGSKTAGKKKGGKQGKVMDSTRNGQDRESDMENGQDYDLDAAESQENQEPGYQETSRKRAISKKGDQEGMVDEEGRREQGEEPNVEEEEEDRECDVEAAESPREEVKKSHGKQKSKPRTEQTGKRTKDVMHERGQQGERKSVEDDHGEGNLAGVESKEERKKAREKTRDNRVLSKEARCPRDKDVGTRHDKERPNISDDREDVTDLTDEQAGSTEEQGHNMEAGDECMSRDGGRWKTSSGGSRSRKLAKSGRRSAVTKQKNPSGQQGSQESHEGESQSGSVEDGANDSDNISDVELVISQYNSPKKATDKSETAVIESDDNSDGAVDENSEKRKETVTPRAGGDNNVPRSFGSRQGSGKARTGRSFAREMENLHDVEVMRDAAHITDDFADDEIEGYLSSLKQFLGKPGKKGQKSTDGHKRHGLDEARSRDGSLPGKFSEEKTDHRKGDQEDRQESSEVSSAAHLEEEMDEINEELRALSKELQSSRKRRMSGNQEIRSQDDRSSGVKKVKDAGTPSVGAGSGYGSEIEDDEGEVSDVNLDFDDSKTEATVESFSKICKSIVCQSVGGIAKTRSRRHVPKVDYRDKDVYFSDDDYQPVSDELKTTTSPDTEGDIESSPVVARSLISNVSDRQSERSWLLEGSHMKVSTYSKIQRTDWSKSRQRKDVFKTIQKETTHRKRERIESDNFATELFAPKKRKKKDLSPEIDQERLYYLEDKDDHELGEEEATTQRVLSRGHQMETTPSVSHQSRPSSRQIYMKHTIPGSSKQARSSGRKSRTSLISRTEGGKHAMPGISRLSDELRITGTDVVESQEKGHLGPDTLRRSHSELVPRISGTSLASGSGKSVITQSSRGSKSARKSLTSLGSRDHAGEPSRLKTPQSIHSKPSRVSGVSKSRDPSRPTTPRSAHSRVSEVSHASRGADEGSDEELASPLAESSQVQTVAPAVEEPESQGTATDEEDVQDSDSRIVDENSYFSGPAKPNEVSRSTLRRKYEHLIKDITEGQEVDEEELEGGAAAPNPPAVKRRTINPRRLFEEELRQQAAEELEMDDEDEREDGSHAPSSSSGMSSWDGGPFRITDMMAMMGQRIQKQIAEKKHQTKLLTDSAVKVTQTHVNKIWGEQNKRRVAAHQQFTEDLIDEMVGLEIEVNKMMKVNEKMQALLRKARISIDSKYSKTLRTIHSSHMEEMGELDDYLGRNLKKSVRAIMDQELANMRNKIIGDLQMQDMNQMRLAMQSFFDM